ncbi:MAG: TerB family tellurite resistance protein [Weeksellaceae bacterium]
MKKSNKIIAGYNLLNMIATVEGEIDAKADLVIREYLSSEALLRLNLDDELDEIIMLNESNADDHFIQKAKDYYDDSNENEREEFKHFAQDLIRADEEISDGENHCYKLLLKTWRAKDKEQ